MGDSVGINVVPDAVEHEFVDDQTVSIDAFLALCGSVIAPEGSGLHYALFGLVLRSEEGGREIFKSWNVQENIAEEGF